MATNDFTDKAPQNYEQKCPCVLVLDTSSSMSGAPIKELNSSLKEFRKNIIKDATAASRLDIEIITFDSTVQTVQEFSLMEHFEMPTLSTTGATKLVDGVRKGIKRVTARKKWYKDTGQIYYRPFIILITDGEPDSDQDVDALSREIKQGVDNHNFVFLAFGVKGADMNVLRQITPSDSEPPPLLLAENDGFGKFFRWLSMSLTTITGSRLGDEIDITPEKGTFQMTVK